MDGKKRLRVGWFSFSCSEDSTILFTELLNDHYKEWKKLIEFKHFLPLQKKSDLSEMDIAFMEGAITSQEQEKKAKQVRNLAKKIVAVGACAVMGMPAGQRNLFDEKTKTEIESIVARFAYLEKVKKISEVISVDEVVPGCPMSEAIFLQILDKNLKEFGIV